MNKKSTLFSKAIVALSFAFLISSCNLYTGTLLNSASLNAANFSYVSHDIKGTATVDYIFSISSLKKQSLINEAKQKMLASNPLKSNQALANITVGYTYTDYLGVYGKVTCIVTADVVQFK